MIARFAELGWEINRFNGQSPAIRESDFSDRNAEIWYIAGREIGKGKLILPDDPNLHDQMAERKRGPTPREDPGGEQGTRWPTADSNPGQSGCGHGGHCHQATPLQLQVRGRVRRSWRNSRKKTRQSFLERHNIMGADAGL